MRTWLSHARRRALALASVSALVLGPALADQSSLYSPTTGTVSGLNLTNNYNNALNALNTCNSGTAAPSNQLSASPSLGDCWLNTSSSPYALERYDGAQWVAIGWIDATNHWWDPQFGGGSGSIASASTVNLGANPATYLSITGTTTINSFGSSAQVGTVKILTFAAALTLADSSNLILPTGANIGTAAGDIAIAVETASGVWSVAYFRANGTPLANTAGLITPWAITGGLPSSMTGANNTATMSISPFTAADQTDAAVVSDASSINWAVSNGNAINGSADGATLQNSATYHVYACQGPSGVGAYASRTAPGTFVASSCPSGYTQYARRLFSFVTTNAGAPIPYSAIEGPGGALVCYLATQVLDFNTNSLPSGSRTLITLSVPTGLLLKWIGRHLGGGSGIGVILTSPTETDVAATTGTTVPEFDIIGAGTGTPSGLQRETWTNLSGQIGARASSSAANLSLVTSGWGDPRRS